MASDLELVARVKSGDVEAFGELIRRYERSVLAMVIARLRDRHSAEDVTQAALTLAFRRLATLRDGARFGPWLMQIARRQVVDFARKRQTAVEVAAAFGLAETSADSSTDEWIEHDHLLQLVDRLPFHERALVGLRFFDNLSVAEISEITGRPVGTVTKQLSRAAARLRAWLEREN